jgi:hypothetical protein
MTSFWPINCASVGDPGAIVGAIVGLIVGVAVGVIVGAVVGVAVEAADGANDGVPGAIDGAAGLGGAVAGLEDEAGIWLMHPATTSEATSTMPMRLIVYLAKCL